MSLVNENISVLKPSVDESLLCEIKSLTAVMLFLDAMQSGDKMEKPIHVHVEMSTSTNEIYSKACTQIIVSNIIYYVNISKQ